MKKIIVLLLVLLVMLQYKIWLGDGGIPEILQLEDEVETVQLQVDKLKERNQALNAEVQDLKTGMDAIEERARSELGMIGKDEVYYQVISELPLNTQAPSPGRSDKP
ncbi:MAG: cell division protein FtsB [Gammaproteobacteria bacterium]|nr:cell division protein FtsB [Gammaproteobacteria bacterium]